MRAKSYVDMRYIMICNRGGACPSIYTFFGIDRRAGVRIGRPPPVCLDRETQTRADRRADVRADTQRDVRVHVQRHRQARVHVH